MTSPVISRRKWVSAAVSLSALQWSSLARASRPNSVIRVGVIGAGVRGKYLIGNLPESARVTAICDCATSRIIDTLNPKRGFAEVLASFRDRDAAHCKMYQDYRRMLGREPLDAVIIATPDHHHVQAAMLALHAGLDVYLEKPFSLTIPEGRLLADLVKKTGRILQVGSQQRTMELNRFACEFIRDGGLGKVTRVDCPNYPGPLADADFDSDPIPKDLDWRLFLGPGPFRPHSRKLWVKDQFRVEDLLWRGWDFFRDYSGHLMTNWGAHNIDMVQYALGMDRSGPVSVAPLNPDTVGDDEIDLSEDALEQDWRKKWHKKTPRPKGRLSDESRFRPVTMQYATGTVLNFLPGVPTATFFGERGKMRISRNKFVSEPANLISDAPDALIAEKWKGKGFVARPHLQNWMDCIKTRDEPNASAEIGHRSTTVCLLANLVREVDQPLKWDPGQERFEDNDVANNLLDRPRKEGFKLPR